MTIIKKQVIDRFNQSADTYDTAAELQAEVANRVALQLKNMKANTVLEIGCGTGLLSRHLSILFPAASVILTDIAESMIEKCRSQFSNQKQIKVLCMDGENLILESTFDLIVSSMTLHWFLDLEQSIKKIKHQLNQNGRFVFTLLGENSLQEWRQICSRFNIPFATPSFPSREKLQQFFPNLSIQVEQVQKHYSNAHAFLHSLKCLGAYATRSGYQILSAGKLRRILRHFEDKLTMTYEIFYGIYIQS